MLYCQGYTESSTEDTVTIATDRPAPATATCDGSGLIVILTEDGPWTSACLGCWHCTPGKVAITDAQRAARATEVFSVALDDEPF